MKSRVKKYNSTPFIQFENNQVFEVNNEFIDLTGYSRDEVIGLSIDEIDILLKIDFQIHLVELVDKYTCYLFRKDDEPRFVTISHKNLDYNNSIYFIHEVPSSRIEKYFSYVLTLMSTNERLVELYSYQDQIILLKSNRKNLTFLHYPISNFDSNIGRSHIISEYFIQVIEKGTPFFAQEMEFTSPTGESFYWDFSIVPLHKENNLDYIVFEASDVTEKVRNRQHIMDQNNHLEIILEHISDQIVYIDNNGNFRYMNTVSGKNPLYYFLPMTEDKIVNEGSKFFDIDGNLISYENMPTQRVLRGEIVSSQRIFAINNHISYYVEVSGNPIYDRIGTVVGGVMIYKDLSNMIMVEEFSSLEKITKNLELNYASLTYPDFKIAYINDKGYNTMKMFNLDMELNNISYFLGKDFFDFYSLESDKEKTKMEIIDSLNKNSTCYHSKRFVTKDCEKYLKTIFQPVYGSNSEIIRIIAIALDITEEEKEKELLTQNLKMQEDMLINTSHELKTPLNVIYSSVQLLDFFLENNLLLDNISRFKQINNTIKQNCYRLTKLINNIIDYSRIESGDFKLNLINDNIVKVLKEIVESIEEYAFTKGLKINFVSNIDKKVIAFDPFMLERIILNLISNSIKFTSKGGKIDITLIDNDNYIEISVIDTGIGIDENYLEVIFDKFRQVDSSLTRSAEGFGIGLPLVKSLVELHKGKITVESTLGKGSTFKVELPSVTVENPIDTHPSIVATKRVDNINYEFSDIYDIS
ncbi:ATP-binding protein [Tissierella sp. Yu-01]|uniref:sensor histidine kinase n=1 Tax=Tissierella sp. Yu-01 TaxID=3035694 RepID=UPI00240D8007|nr:ATP-binding protein [Tissierella sp. Yu-01]WFA10082.1 ATP-binding protein [Tissierella sp. Yu-01]